MGWIKRRIDKEDSKHRGRLDWSAIAEAKIVSELMERECVKCRVKDHEAGWCPDCRRCWECMGEGECLVDKKCVYKEQTGVKK